MKRRAPAWVTGGGGRGWGGGGGGMGGGVGGLGGGGGRVGVVGEGGGGGWWEGGLGGGFWGGGGRGWGGWGGGWGGWGEGGGRGGGAGGGGRGGWVGGGGGGGGGGGALGGGGGGGLGGGGVGWGHAEMGQLLVRQGRCEQALEPWRKGRRTLSDNQQGYVNLSRAYFDLGQYEDALGWCLQSIEVHPTAAALLEYGTILYYLERYAEAVEAFSEGGCSETVGMRALGNLGSTYMWIRRVRQQANDVLEPCHRSRSGAAGS